MRRLILCAVAIAMLAGSLAMTALSEDTPFDSLSAGAAPRSVTMSEGTPAESWSANRREAPASARAVLRGDRARAHENQIWFRPPIDFATGAFPSSAAFNAAEGDQLSLTLTHATLSDSVAVGDFNHDGNPDVAQSNVIAGSLSVFLGDGRAGFAPPTLQPVGVHPNFVVTGDLDGDGHLDVVVANSGSNNLTILRGDGNGNFEPNSVVAVPDPRNVAIGNFNGDGIPDLAVASSAPSVGCPARCDLSPVGGVAILTGTKVSDEVVVYQVAQFMTYTPNGTIQPVGANYVAAGDFDGSGLDDLAVGVGTQRSAGDQPSKDSKPTGDDLLIFLNLNEAAQDPFSNMPSQPAIRVGATPDAIAVADLNGDNHPDLAVLDNGSGDITTLLGDSRGRFVVRATNVTVGAVPRSLAVGDFNDDGFRDLVTSSFGASTVSVLQGNGDGTFQPAVDFWAGDAPTGVAMGHFDDDGRLDVVAARLRTDQLSLLLNDSPQRGDGVVIKRDIPFVSPDGDPFAAHHTLDIYLPPRGTVSFAGKGQPYPVVFFVHGGAGVSGDKSMVSYLMRSFAVDGIVAVSTNYRLCPCASREDQTNDVGQAFHWTRDNVGSRDYGGDPNNIFVFGNSAGGALVARLATEAVWGAQKDIRGLLLAGSAPPVPTPFMPNAEQPPSLLFNGTEGLEIALLPSSLAFAAASSALEAESEHVTVLGRDHFTLLSNIALAGDEGRVAILNFIQTH